MSDHAFDEAVAGARVLRRDAMDFKAGHDFKGHPSAIVIRQMREEGFACGIEHLNLLHPVAEGVGRWEWKLTPLIVCNRVSTATDDVCISRRVTFDIGWQDAEASEQSLLLQVEDSLVTHQTYHCTPRLPPR
ncbi:hypothetical protein ACQ86G_18975 [Roseateles chitinivorans]|uniref:hypothetical protein n=1 Tax=Roseateles chitinivorans TaxID=2917965 RepID=UPI003D66CC0B